MPVPEPATLPPARMYRRMRLHATQCAGMLCCAGLWRWNGDDSGGCRTMPPCQRRTGRFPEIQSTLVDYSICNLLNPSRNGPARKWGVVRSRKRGPAARLASAAGRQGRTSMLRRPVQLPAGISRPVPRCQCAIWFSLVSSAALQSSYLKFRNGHPKRKEGERVLTLALPTAAKGKSHARNAAQRNATRAGSRTRSARE